MTKLRAARPFVVLATLAGLVTAVTARVAFPHGTVDLDEVSYQAQANALRAGHLTLARSAFDPFFRPFLSGLRGNRLVFKYEPVWPALIGVSDALVHSPIPLQVALSAAGVSAVAWFAWELLADRRIALVAGALLLASPFTWVQSASLLGYQLSLVLGTAVGAGLLRAARTRSRGAGVTAGVLLGLALLHRPFDAVLAAVPVLAYAGWAAWRAGGLGRLAGSVALGSAPFGAVLLAYDRAVMGSAFRLPFGVTSNIDTFGFGWRASFVARGAGHRLQVHYTVGRAVSTLWRELAAFPRFVVAAPVVLVLAGAVMWLRRGDTRAWLLAAMVGIVIAGYVFWWGTANAFRFGLDHALGPFYEYPVLPPLCIAAAWGLTIWKPPRALAAGLGVIAVAWTVAFSVVVWNDARTDGRVRSREVSITVAAGRRLVLQQPQFAGDPYVRVANDARLRGDALVAMDLPGRRLEVIDRFPDRVPYLIRLAHRPGDPFGPSAQDRVRLVVTRGSALRVRLRGGATASGFLRVGGGPMLRGSSWRLTARVLDRGAPGRSRDPVVVTVGAGRGAECRFEARVTATGIEALTPCDGFHRYVFPNGAEATVREDVSGGLRLRVDPAPG